MLFTQPVLWYAIHIVGRAGPTVEQLMLGVCGVSPALRDATYTFFALEKEMVHWEHLVESRYILKTNADATGWGIYQSTSLPNADVKKRECCKKKCSSLSTQLL